MRFLFGIVVGVLLVIGAAYVHDASIDPAGEPAAKRLVDWTVASEQVQGINHWIEAEWIWLNEKFRRPA